MGIYDVTIQNNGQSFSDPASFTVANPVPQLLFTSDSSQVTSAGYANAVWSDVLPQPGSGNEAGLPSPLISRGFSLISIMLPGTMRSSRATRRAISPSRWKGPGHFRSADQ